MSLFAPVVGGSRASSISEFSEDVLDAFAKLCIKDPVNRNAHARAVCGGDHNRAFALLAATNDNDFTLRMTRIKDTINPNELTKTQTEFEQDLQDFISAEPNGKVKLDAMRLMAEIKGYLKKDVQTPVALQVNNVMVVPEQVRGDDWEAKARAYQQDLIDEARGISNG